MDETLSFKFNPNSKDNFEFHIKRDTKYRAIYRISQELINKTTESINNRITDMIRNNGERLKLIKAVPFSIGTQACTMLKRCLYVFVTVYDIFPTI